MVYFLNLSFEVFTAVMFQVDVFWVMTLCSVVVGYQRFGGPCCLHLQGEVDRKKNGIDIGPGWRGAAGVAGKFGLFWSNSR
jgi:hypothetical protein